MVGKWLLMIAEQFGRPEVFDAASTTIDNQTRLPYKINIHLTLKNADDGEIEEE